MAVTRRVSDVEISQDTSKASGTDAATALSVARTIVESCASTSVKGSARRTYATTGRAARTATYTMSVRTVVLCRSLLPMPRSRAAITSGLDK